MSIKTMIATIANVAVALAMEPLVRYQWRKSVVEKLSVDPVCWYAAGFMKQHSTIGLFELRANCGAVIFGATSNQEIRTLWPIHCLACRRVERRAARTTSLGADR